jgi:hypothetical protein
MSVENENTIAARFSTDENLNNEAKDFIRGFVCSHYREWFPPISKNPSFIARDTAIRERTIRVEKSLDEHYKLMRQELADRDKRLEQYGIQLTRSWPSPWIQ